MLQHHKTLVVGHVAVCRDRSITLLTRGFRLFAVREFEQGGSVISVTLQKWFT